MPNYEYRCDDCGHEFEKLVPLVDYDRFQSCPATWYGSNRVAGGYPPSTCNGKARRVIRGSTGIAFKGPGWTPKFY